VRAPVNAGGGVLVHCQAGISRSATVVIGYVMWKDRMGADAATARVTAARDVVWPNPGFKCQLREFEALGCDASRWAGWSMMRFLTSNYGNDSADFMASMLGPSPATAALPGGRQCQQQDERQQQLGACGVAPHGSSSSGSGSGSSGSKGSSIERMRRSRSSSQGLLLQQADVDTTALLYGAVPGPRRSSVDSRGALPPDRAGAGAGSGALYGSSAPALAARGSIQDFLQ
jgi:hypothetical protein